MIVNPTTGAVALGEDGLPRPATVDEVKEVVAARKAAYCRLFRVDGDPASGLTEDAKLVLADLAAFCRLTEALEMFDNAGRADALMTFQRSGRREVGQRIVNHINLSVDELMRIFNPAMR